MGRVAVGRALARVVAALTPRLLAAPVADVRLAALADCLRAGVFFVRAGFLRAAVLPLTRDRDFFFADVDLAVDLRADLRAVAFLRVPAFALAAGLRVRAAEAFFL
ncbi:MAG: hypothetical protein ACREIV_13695 [Planctomycetaceae bacterium]